MPLNYQPRAGRSRCRSTATARLVVEQSLVHHLCDLASGGGVIGTEGVVGVAAQRAVGVNRLYVAVEGVVGRDVTEGGSGGHEEFPQGGLDYHFGELAPGDAVGRVERAVGISRGYEPVVGGL